MTAVWIAGTRTFSAEVAGFAVESGLEPVGWLDPSERDSASGKIDGLPVARLGDERQGDRIALIGTGDSDRRQVVAQLEAAGWEIAGLVHPRAHVSASATVAPTALVGPGCVVGARTTIGDHAVLGRGALVGHHTSIGPFATLNPGANVAGNAAVGEGAFVGMSAAVRDHTEVGEWATVSMGAVVVSPVAAGATVRGVPAR